MASTKASINSQSVFNGLQVIDKNKFPFEENELSFKLLILQDWHWENAPRRVCG